MDMKCMPGTKIMVTSRSKDVVRTLLESRVLSMTVGGSIEGTSSTISVVPVPSLTDEEAIQALRSYCCDASFFIADEDLRKIALNFWFFEEQCHPLCLKLQGAALRQVIPWTFVRLHYDDYTADRMHEEVRLLEYHGLLEVVHHDGLQPRLVIHDLLKRVAKSRVTNHVDALVNSAIRIHSSIGMGLPHFTTDELWKKKHVVAQLPEEEARHMEIILSA
ncbi:hypothetical protein GOP47_0003849 [Adiantum capillus-veneris]|uniref:Uncharacterized protein n=1 Tax=Adiantum capillus-veneris TaxID=13818 RepID=A0A9D4ZP66_ADICA|nr:hypothetical protein GOP47_0003849 [Adiantum capillus-veneris]